MTVESLVVLNVVLLVAVVAGLAVLVGLLAAIRRRDGGPSLWRLFVMILRWWARAGRTRSASPRRPLRSTSRFDAGS